MRLVCLAALALLAGCTPSSSTTNDGIDAGAAPGSPCIVTSDCVARALCAYPIADGCNAQGVCVTEDPTCTNNGPVVCACDGTPVGLACIYTPGYAPAPVLGTTPGCAPFDGGMGLDSGTDGGGMGGDDATEADGGAD
jgi:hypothetical protein